MIFAIPLAWLQLIREKVRLLIALAGIAFAVLLMMIQMGFRDALFDASVTLHQNLDADIVILSPQSTNLIALKSFSRRRLFQAAGVEGVQSFSPLYLQLALWRNPDTKGTRQILLLGVNPEDKSFTLPEFLENRDRLKRPDVVLFDRLSREQFGPIGQWFDEGKTVETEIADRKVSVAGLFNLGTSFAADGNLITSDLNFLRIVDSRSPGLIDLGLLTLAPGEDAATMVRTIQDRIPDDVMVLTKQEFIEFEQRYWQTSTSIGFIFNLGSAMGFVVGMVIVYQILYTDVSDHLAEYATLKAMGYKSRFLFSVVLQEAIILSVIGFIPGLGASAGLYSLTKNATGLPIGLTIERGITVFLLTSTMCLVAGIIAMRKVQAADPADIF
ncbi:MAG: ABC transporter permease DevC [Cyanobacteria bacterium P01_F01_bin.42]